MKQTVEEAAKEYADRLYEPSDRGVLYRETQNDFIAGAKWRESQIPEHISTVQDCELAVRVTKEKAIDALRISLGKWVHGNKVACVIEAFEELINK